MSHAGPARPLKAAIISPDSDVLLELSEVLSAVGLSVLTSKDVGENAAWRHFSEIDFVLFDGRLISNPTQFTLGHRSENPSYRILLYAPDISVDLAAWFAAGANDALRFPISRGELLVRVKTGARVLEMERRLRTQSSRSRFPNMYSLRGFVRRLNTFLDGAKSISEPRTLIAISIDFFAEFGREQGEAAARSLVETVVASLRQSTSDNAIAAYDDDRTFYILLPGQDLAAAKVVAGHIAQNFRTAQVDVDLSARQTVSTAIVPWHAGVTAERLIEQGNSTLSIAEQAGGDCTMKQNEYAGKLSSWKNELTTGNPFANSTAQDVMEPFPALLERDSPNHALLVALQRSGVPVWPYVDREGRLVGVASPSPECGAATAPEPNSRKSHAITRPTTIPRNASFSEIKEAFSKPGCQTLVVLADRRPLGYITRGAFHSLFEPLNSATFSHREPSVEDSRSLLVGLNVNESELASGSDPLHPSPVLGPQDRTVLPALR
jgi:two-component system, cell cycle response regulator